MPAKQHSFLCFTLNNYTEPLPLINDKISYICYQRETAPSTGTKHLQGYVQFVRKITMTGASKMVGFERCSWRQCHGSFEDNLRYCTREFNEDGSRKRDEGTEPYIAGTPKSNGVSTSYEEMIFAIQDGQPEELIKSKFMGQYIRHKRAVDEVLANRKKLKVSDITVPPIVLKKWQVDILNIIAGPVSDRTIYWYYDTIGGQGKSTFARYLIKNYSVLMADRTEKSRLVYAMHNDPKHVVIFDITRDEGRQNQVNYGTMETLQSGVGFNTMYHPQTVYWPQPHIIVFSNFPPDPNALSADRLAIVNLNPELDAAPFRAWPVFEQRNRYPVEYKQDQ